MRYGFLKCGGFAAVDDSRRVAAFAYRTSPNADSAIVWPREIAEKMLANTSAIDGTRIGHERITGIDEAFYKMVANDLTGRELDRA